MPFRFALAAAVAFAATRALASEPLGVSEDEFKMFRHAKLALEDKRVQAMKPEVRLAAIARDGGYKLKDLQKAMDKVEAAGDLKARCEASVREAVDQKELAGHIGKVEVDTSVEHAVIYAQWLNEEPKALPVEASLLAFRAAEACPIASTVQVWALDKANPKARVFQALISAGGAKRINPDKARDYAETRYLKLFEKVKSINNGDDFSAEDAAAAAEKH